MNLQEKAAAALTWFERGERESTDTGERIWVVKDPHGAGEPGEWVRDLAWRAHGEGDGQMLPDDWRYELIRQALDYLAEGNDPDDFNPEPPVYNSELLRWLGSHGWRPGYCDQYDEEFGATEGSMMDRIGRGWCMEATEVYILVCNYLEGLPDEDDNGEPIIYAAAS